MKIRIPEPTSWRPDARRLYAFGTYRVPEDMPEELARQAISDGVATLVEEDQPSMRRPQADTPEAVKRGKRGSS